MGTSVEAWAHTEADFRATVEWFERVEDTCSRFRPESEVSRLNRDERSSVRLSPMLASVLTAAQEMRDLTNGLVDAGMGASLVDWGYDRSLEQLVGLDAAPPPRPAREWFVMDGFLHREPGTAIDLGGIGKGWACDAAVETGRAVVVSAGGDIRSADPATIVPVTDPWGATVATVALGKGALATSSTMNRRWRVGQGSAHHLIDPRTGRPADSPIVSATVITRAAVQAEAGAKTVLLLGEEGLAWASESEWIDAALVIWHDGSVFATRTLELAA